MSLGIESNVEVRLQNNTIHEDNWNCTSQSSKQDRVVVQSEDTANRVLQAQIKNKVDTPLSNISKQAKPTKNVGFLCSRLKFIVKNLEHMWPPDSCNLEKMELKSFRKTWLKPAYKLLKGSNYCALLHDNVDFMKMLNDAFSDNVYLTQSSLKNLQQHTGLSQMAIKIWFRWKRLECGYFTPKQILFSAFNNSQYLNEDDVSNLVTKTGLTENVIRSWFRVSRALANVFDVEQVDKEEMILWRMFEIHKSGISDSVVNLVSYLINMDKRHVFEIFLTWCQRYDVPNGMTPPILLSDNVEIDELTLPFSSSSLANHETLIKRIPKSINCFLKQKSLSDSNLSILSSNICNENSLTSETQNLNKSRLARSFSAPVICSSTCDEMLVKNNICCEPVGIEQDVEECFSNSLLQVGQTDSSNFDTSYSSDENQLVIDLDYDDTQQENCPTKRKEELCCSSTAIKQAFVQQITKKARVSDKDAKVEQRNVYDATNHASVVKELKKLRRKQFQEGIPCKTKKVGGILTPKKRKRRVKEKYSHTEVPAKQKLSEKFSAEVEIDPEPSFRELKAKDELVNILRQHKEEGSLKMESKFSVTSSLHSSSSVEDDLFYALQDCLSDVD